MVFHVIIPIPRCSTSSPCFPLSSSLFHGFPHHSHAFHALTPMPGLFTSSPTCYGCPRLDPHARVSHVITPACHDSSMSSTSCDGFPHHHAHDMVFHVITPICHGYPCCEPHASLFHVNIPHATVFSPSPLFRGFPLR